MNTKVINKLLNKAAEKLNILKNRHPKNFNTAVNLEKDILGTMTMMREIDFNLSRKKNFSESDYEVFSTRKDKIYSEILELLDSNAEKILENFNERYNLNLTVEIVKITHGKYYLKNGIFKTIYMKYISSMFNEVFENNLPKHPKELYTKSRSIKRKVIIHVGGTNSGKTFSALERLKSVKHGIYLSPLRLLALEVYEKLNSEAIRCNLLTGEEEIISPNATHTSCTVEKANLELHYDVVVIDECQMISDTQRGSAWTRAILGVYADEVHLCCSPNALELLSTIVKDCGDELEVIEHRRDTPLVVEKKGFSFPRDIAKGDALIVFSRAMVLKIAAILREQKITSSIIYGNLPPETRRKQVEMFVEGETEVVVSTDAIGMGLNLPIKRIVFLETEKFDGESTRLLNESEIKQISGRAGRRGIYDIGYVNSTNSKHYIKDALECEDRAIETAYIFPDENLLLNRFSIGTLKERLTTWNNYKLDYEYFEKADISELLELLNYLDRFQESDKDILIKKYKLILTPFNSRNETLLDYWTKCAHAILKDKPTIYKPLKAISELKSLENYYQLLAIYYYISNAFNLPIDKEWLNAEREDTSEQIHEYLKKEIKKYIVKCKVCGKTLPWNSFYKICQKCYNKNLLEYYEDF